jgi:hypothetical protein
MVSLVMPSNGETAVTDQTSATIQPSPGRKWRTKSLPPPLAQWFFVVRAD